ncbi:MAG: beta-glucosidase, partial [Sphingobacteriales bacterium]
VAMAIALEAKARGIRQILSPVVNIASDVRWGRVEETYGEDPYLSSEIGVAFVSAFEKQNIITTPKHFLANTGDGGRDSYPIHWNERLLEEIHLPPFKALIQRGGSRSVMTSYNSINGSPASANDWLLNQKLKKEWGFTGFVISDAGAVGGANVLHFTTKDYPASGASSVNNGLDVIFQTNQEHHKLFDPHFLDGTMQQAVIDSAVARVLRAKFELGLFENPYVSEATAQQWLAAAKHKPVAKKAALESIVLLQNNAVAVSPATITGTTKTAGTIKTTGTTAPTGTTKTAGTTATTGTTANSTIGSAPILPLKKNLRSVAVIGTDASEARLGGYSGPGNNKISILDGIRKKIGSSKVAFAPGPGIHAMSTVPVPATSLKYKSGSEMNTGLMAEYFDNINLQGSPVLKRTDNAINFKWTFMPPDEKLRTDNYSVRWTGSIQSPVTGTYRLGLEGNDGFRMYIDNKLVIDNWNKQSYHSRLIKHAFVKDKAYAIRVEFFEPVGNAAIKLVWDHGVPKNQDELIRQAVSAASKSEIAIIVAGIHEGEFQD